MIGAPIQIGVPIGVPIGVSIGSRVGKEMGSSQFSFSHTAPMTSAEEVRASCGTFFRAVPVAKLGFRHVLGTISYQSITC
jgi:hypothetical protein